MDDIINSFKRFPTFRIEDNVLIGEKIQPVSKYRNAGELLIDILESDPDFVGQIDAISNKKTTYAEMRENSVKCALWLKQQNIKPGDVIAIATHHHINAYIPCLAALCNGIAFNMWDYNLSAMDAKYNLSLTNPKIIFANEISLRAIKKAIENKDTSVMLVTFDEVEGYDLSLEKIITAEISANEIKDFQCVKIEDPEHIAMLMFSSGSSGLPKPVAISHQSLMNIENAFMLFFDDSQVIICLTPLCWITCVIVMFDVIICRVTRIITPTINDETELFQILQKHELSWVMAGVSMFCRLINSDLIKKYKLKTSKKIFVTGGKISEEMLRLSQTLIPNLQIIQFYGMTEAGLVSCSKNNKINTSSGTVGHNVQLKVVDENTKNTLGPNKRGEICVKTLSFLTRYHKNPAASRNLIDSDGWLHTGDLGYFDKNGEVYIVDRIKELIKYRGYHISPIEIEQFLEQHSAVKEVAVTSIPHKTDGEHAVAFVQKIPETNVTEEDLLHLVNENFSENKRLHAGVIFVDEIPHTSTGKIKRFEIKQWARIFAKE